MLGTYFIQIVICIRVLECILFFIKLQRENWVLPKSVKEIFLICCILDWISDATLLVSATELDCNSYYIKELYSIKKHSKLFLDRFENVMRE